jgi:hypothetical protein
MSTVVVAVAPLVGVVIGALLTPWVQGRAEIRRTFQDAIGALALVAASTNYPIKTGPGGVEDPAASADLQRRMHEEFISSLLEARRALAKVAPLCPEIVPFLTRWQDVQVPAEQVRLSAILNRSLHRRLGISLRRKTNVDMLLSPLLSVPTSRDGRDRESSEDNP